MTRDEAIMYLWGLHSQVENEFVLSSESEEFESETNEALLALGVTRDDTERVYANLD
jgi:hypothetical protein